MWSLSRWAAASFVFEIVYWNFPVGSTCDYFILIDLYLMQVNYIINNLLRRSIRYNEWPEPHGFII